MKEASGGSLGLWVLSQIESKYQDIRQTSQHRESEQRFAFWIGEKCLWGDATGTDQAGVDVEVDSVAGLVAPGGGVQGGTHEQFVRESLTHPAPDPKNNET